MSEKISRRNFLRTATLGAAAAGLLAGCGNSGASVAEPKPRKTTRKRKTEKTDE